MRLLLVSLVVLAAPLVADEARAGDPTPSPPIVTPVPTTHVTLNGPAQIRVGERVHLSVNADPATFCYRPGTAAKRCFASEGDWWVTIRSGSTQYFTVRQHGVVIARLVYHHVA